MQNHLNTQASETTATARNGQHLNIWLLLSHLTRIQGLNDVARIYLDCQSDEYEPLAELLASINDEIAAALRLTEVAAN